MLIISCKKSENTDSEIPKSNPDPIADELSVQLDSELTLNHLSEPLTLDSFYTYSGFPMQSWIDSVIPSWNDSLGSWRYFQNSTQLSAYDQKNQLIAKLISSAWNISSKHLSDFHNEAEPFHYGVGYSYGSRDYTTRKQPPTGNELHKSYQYYGLDCSGFMFNILRQSGIAVSDFSVTTFEQTLSEALQQSDYDSLELVNMGQLQANEVQPGDFLVWLNGGDHHIGLAAGSGTQARVYNSHGTGYPGTIQDQEKNWSNTKGVTSNSYNDMLSNSWRFHSQPSIIRLVPKTNCDNIPNLLCVLTGGSFKKWGISNDTTWLDYTQGILYPFYDCGEPYTGYINFFTSGKVEYNFCDGQSNLDPYIFSCDTILNTITIDATLIYGGRRKINLISWDNNTLAVQFTDYNLNGGQMAHGVATYHSMNNP